MGRWIRCRVGTRHDAVRVGCGRLGAVAWSPQSRHDGPHERRGSPARGWRIPDGCCGCWASTRSRRRRASPRSLAPGARRPGSSTRQSARGRAGGRMMDGRRPADTVPSESGFDSPEAYIAGDRRRALSEGRELPDRVHGAAIFADISGFTTVTEALVAELGPQRGAEELTANLNRVFHAVIDDLDRFGGNVVYFSGDAVTCWLDGDDGARAATCAMAMQETMRASARSSPQRERSCSWRSRSPSPLARRGGSSSATPRYSSSTSSPAASSTSSRPPSSLADQGRGRARGSRRSRPRGQSRRSSSDASDDESGDVVAVLAAHEGPSDRATGGRAGASPCRKRSCGRGSCRSSTSVSAPGRGEFLAELRPAIPVFVRFAGIDYDADDDGRRQARRFRSARAQQVLDPTTAATSCS